MSIEDGWIAEVLFEKRMSWTRMGNQVTEEEEEEEEEVKEETGKRATTSEGRGDGWMGGFGG